MVIPAFNEAAGIAAIMQRVLALQSALTKVGIAENFELIVVDDGSTDQTAAFVLEQPCVQLLQHTKNSGYGAA